jgi:outer membrane DcaP-like protein
MSAGGKRTNGRLARAAACTLALALVTTTAAWGQSTSKPATKSTAKRSTPTTSAQLAEQKRQIDEQRRRISEQQSLIERQRSAIDSLAISADSQAVVVARQTARLAALDTQLVDMKKRLEILESQSNLPGWEDKLEERIKKVEAATQKSPELPPDVVSAGDFPGSIRIPGSDAAIKFGARIRTAVVLTLDPLGTDDRFLTSSIPVGQPSAGGDARRTNISARASRLNIEFRTPGGREEVRAFFEGDFAGAGDQFRLRHGYAQYRGFIVGQTWSTFSDPNVNIEDLDFEGISSENVIRQPQLRYWWRHHGDRRFAIAVETPQVSVTGGTGVNLVPDLIMREYVGFQGGGHVQVAAVLRQIRAQSASGAVTSTWGAGGTVSGVVAVPLQGLTDRLMYQVNAGSGIARYINDLNPNSLGTTNGQDAVFDTTSGELKALPVVGWYVGYEHRWKEWKRLQTMNLRSTVLWSRVAVDNPDFQPPESYKRTDRLAVNVVFSPSGRVDAGLEYIYGVRENFDGQSAHANQFQLVGLFRF